jgi:transcription-repair coupling factor (superfamily II helicase)
LLIKEDILSKNGRTLLSGVPRALDALAIAEIVHARAQAGDHLHVALDDRRVAELLDALAFFAPGMPVIVFPAWDCLPYDRISPHPDVAAARVDALAALAEGSADGRPRIVLTTVNAALQRVPSAKVFREAVFGLAKGARLDLEALTRFLADNGYSRTGTVREAGEYALRGGIVDIFPTGAAEPVRLDLFGDEVEDIRRFDPATQRSSEALDGVTLRPVSEAVLNEASIARFRSGYREAFGAVGDDPLYEAVSEGRRHVGMEHWLPLFHEGMETLFEYVRPATVTLDHQAEDSAAERLEAIRDFFEARQAFLESRRRGDRDDSAPYRPLPPDRLYLAPEEWEKALHDRPTGCFSPFAAPQGEGGEGYVAAFDLKGRRCRDFAAARREGQIREGGEAGEGNVFDALGGYIAAQQKRGRRVAIAGFSTGSRERLARLMAEHGIGNAAPVADWAAFLTMDPAQVGLCVLGFEHGFETGTAVVIGEQDILGDRLVRPRQRRRAEAFISDAAELSPGDLVVHIDHGIGRYEGLETVTVGGAPHDCLRLTYAGNDRLFVPVENVELLSRYGSGDSEAALDRLGGAAWQARKSKLRKRLRDMAEALIRIAAQRTLQPGRKLAAQPGLFEEFCARFPYTETDDQHAAIADTLNDLTAGRPMDRLVCGDVGFGKTEVALRAAFNAVMAGTQVAVVVPTTLLARQHFATFRDRFQGYPVRIEQLSRMVSPKTAGEVKVGLADGSVDIVVGTHALLGKSIRFKDLALLIVDEEQHFGVAHKEQLKALRADVHVLTLTATPIPRTLQMALTGVKDMSMIATPPVDRLAVRTFILPYDPVIVREAIMRERFRGGQVFYVCPRIRDLAEVEQRLRELVPEARIGVAHGQMGARALEDAMTAFYDGRFDLLLSTQIVESGLDIPTANTLIVHRADMFGLAQLYQLRGRIGRSKLRGYCYLTLPPHQVLTTAAQRRLEVMQSLDSLGAGFQLASHDLDIRGAGNLLGEEQSGHIREVGVELYQHMLEEAVATARGGGAQAEDEWSPQINIGSPVLIPEKYVTDLDARLGLYRRAAALESEADLESFAAEMIDRFGPLPDEVENLLSIVAIKQLCRRAGIAKLDAGPKGAVVSFHNDAFADPAALIRFIQEGHGNISLRPDHKMVYRRDWERPATRLRGARELARGLAAIAG